jgi:hypothetical protein
MSDKSEATAMDEYLREASEGKTGIFRDHTCWKCRNGARPCVNGSSSRCDYPRARND